MVNSGGAGKTRNRSGQTELLIYRLHWNWTVLYTELYTPHYTYHTTPHYPLSSLAFFHLAMLEIEKLKHLPFPCFWTD